VLVRDPYWTVSDAIAALGHGWTAAEPELTTLNGLDVPQAHLDVMQELCSLSMLLAKVLVMQQQRGGQLKTNVQAQLEVQASLGRRQDLVSWERVS